MAPRPFKRSTERLFREPRRQDPYRTQSKPRGTPQCPDCAAICIRGAWLPEAEVEKNKEKILRKATKRCPACQQKKDRYALGVVELHGTHWKNTREEVLRMVQKTEKIARARNDQHRILWNQSTKGVLKIYVSMPELARHLGRELEKSFKGLTEYERSTEEPYIRVRWWSDFPENLQEENSKSRSFRGRGKP